MINALFICSRNRLRSPTAEQVFASWPGVETDSAGLAPDADFGLDAEQIAWADYIFVMEAVHQRRLTSRFGRHLRSKKVICLDIPDIYTLMQPELVAVLESKVGRYLRTVPSRDR
jgi:predicted protein tyrosine phosphatase